MKNIKQRLTNIFQEYGISNYEIGYYPIFHFIFMKNYENDL